MKTTFHVLIALFLLLPSLAVADEALWQAQLVHPDTGPDEWVISQAVAPTKPEKIADAFKTIYAKDKQPRIRHVALGELFKRADLQADVIAYLESQPAFNASLPPFGHNRWGFKNSAEIPKLVSAALLQSKFVESLNKELAAFGWKATDTNMEKLFFTKDDGKT